MQKRLNESSPDAPLAHKTHFSPAALAYVEQMCQDADAGDASALARVDYMRLVVPRAIWPACLKKQRDFISEAPRALVLSKPARAIPVPPPLAPVVFRKIAIHKPPPTHAAPLANAVFVRTLTVNGKKPAPLLLRKPAPVFRKATPPQGAKVAFRRSGAPEI